MINSSYRQILKIAAPMMLANLSVPLLGLVDTALLGHQEEAVYLGATALGAQVIAMIFWAFGFLRMGTTGFTARARGIENDQETYRRLLEALSFAITIGLGILLIHPLALGPLISLLSDASGELSSLALEYTSIRIWAAPAALMTYAFLGWLIGLQDTRSVMWILVVTNLLNIIFDYVLIVELELASAGAAWASLAAEYLGCGLGAILVTRKLSSLNIATKLPDIDWKSLGEMFHSSRHLFVRTLCLLFTFLFFTSQGALIDSETAAANAILLNLLALTAYTMDGFAHAAEALCGKAWGANNRADFLDTCKKTSVLAAAMAILCTAILLIGREPIFAIYTNLEAVRQIALQDYLWLAFLPLIAVWCYQLDGIFIGIGHSLTMQNAMLLATLGIFIPVWWLTQTLGNTGLWLTMFSFHIARIAGLAVPFFHIIQKDREKG